MTRVKVEMRQEAFNGRYIAWCHADTCKWAMADPSKTYVQDRMRAHRHDHAKPPETKD